MQWLVIKLASIEAETVEYALLGKNQQQDNFSPSNWSQLKALSRGKRIILLIPTEDVVLNSANIPATSAKLLAKAVPYALEDHLAEDIDELHFVYHRESAGQSVYISAINKERLQQWLDKLREHDLTPHIVLPDVFALPAGAEEGAVLSIHDNQQRALFRSSIYSGFVTDSGLLPALLPELLEKLAIQSLVLDKPEEVALDLPDSIHIQTTPPLHRLCSADLLHALPLNLLSRFVQKGQKSVLSNLSQWKSVAALAALIGLSWIMTTGVKNYRLNQQLAGLNESIANVYQQTFPDTPVNDDYRVLHSIMAEKLKSVGGDSAPKADSPLELLASIGPQIKQHKQITVSALRFDKTGLNLSITAPSLAGLEKFRAAIDTGNIDAEVISSTSSANKVESTLNIKKESL